MFCLECGGAPAKVQYVEVEEEDEVEKDAAVETEETDSAMAQAGTPSRAPKGALGSAVRNNHYCL